MDNVIVYNAKVMPRGRIILPKEIREKIGVGIGDQVTLICRDGKVVIMNTAEEIMESLNEALTYLKMGKGEKLVKRKCPDKKSPVYYAKSKTKLKKANEKRKK